MEQWGRDDQLGLLRQLGLIPALLGLIFVAGICAGLGMGALVRRLRP